MNCINKLVTCLIAASPAMTPTTSRAISYEPEDVAGSVIIEAPKADRAPETAAIPATLSDTAKLLQDNPAISIYGAGGISSLPALHGMADDRIRIQLDGIDAMTSCPNHMNPPLSLFAPNQADRITVMAGITPVSAGGDSIAGTIQIDSPRPEFAAVGEPSFTQGQAGVHYRSNGDAHGASLTATYANAWFNLTYNGSTSESNNVHAASDFKAAGDAAAGRAYLAGNEIGSTAYKTENNQLTFAVLHEKQLLELSASLQDVPYEQFPTQRMDMLQNHSKQFNLHYEGSFDWGKFNARVFEQLTSHAMNFGPDKQIQYGTAQGMPMNTEAKTRGITVRADMPLTKIYSATAGADILDYQLNDWWPPATTTVSGMGPGTFQNIHNGQRNRYAIYGEVNSNWDNNWSAQLGVRSEIVNMNTGNVEGYNSMAMYTSDAAQFNAQAHQRNDHHLDLTAVLRHNLTDIHSFEVGYAQKTRSPNLYERYSWSAAGMAAVMNNFVGDGNGYVGNADLKPEVAHTISASWDSHDPENRQWKFRLTPYATYVSDFVDAQRCPINFSTNCSKANLTATDAFVTLQYVNQNAQFYGVDGSGSVHLGQVDKVGDFHLSGLFSFTRGENRNTHDNLYNIMPMHTRLALNRQSGKWSNTLEWEAVAAKDNVSAVRNENQTGGYGLINLKNSYRWKQMRIDFGVDNLFNRNFAPPLGGAYVGQGKTMGQNSVEWGVPVPGLGRSFNTALTLQF